MSGSVQKSPDPLWLVQAERHLPDASLRRVAWMSILTIIFGIGGVIAWAGTARIDSAVPATGVIVASGKRKTITIQDGGLLRELLVHEGDHVIAGQVLMRLDDVQTQSTRNQAKVQYWSAMARTVRLNAEAADKRTLPITSDLYEAAKNDPAIAAAVSAETSQFEMRWAALDSAIRVQERKIAQTQAQIGAMHAQIASLGIRLSLTREQLRNLESLLARGLETKPHQLDILRAEADLVGQINQLANQLTQAEESIAQTKQEIINTQRMRYADISKDRADTQAAATDAAQRLRAAEDQLQKREVTSPEAGVITDLKFFTIGSSIVPGQPIMDLVPETQRLLIEGNVAPNEVEHLSIGQPVNIRLAAYKAHRVPVITGRLTYVGADRQLDANNQPVFLVRAEIDSHALDDKPGVVLLPGMPADVLIVNGNRSVLSFLISPITDSLFSGMKEE